MDHFVYELYLIRTFAKIALPDLSFVTEFIAYYLVFLICHVFLYFSLMYEIYPVG